MQRQGSVPWPAYARSRYVAADIVGVLRTRQQLSTANVALFGAAVAAWNSELQTEPLPTRDSHDDLRSAIAHGMNSMPRVAMLHKLHQ